MKKLAMGAALALSLVGASSASAADWMPLNTTATAVQEGHGKLTVAGGLAVTCNTGDATLTALSGSPTVAMASSTAVGFNSCIDPLGAAAFVTTFGTWNFIATSTTNVDAQVTNGAAGNLVATISLPTLGCEIVVPGPVNIPNNTWNNATHTLTINSSFKFPVHANTEGCSTLVGTTGNIDASYHVTDAANNVTIT